MNKIFNCCHGMFEPQHSHWMCNAKSAEGGRVDEEIIGDDGHAYNRLTTGEEMSGKLGHGGSRSGGRSRAGPPMPVGSQEDDKETAKSRLQKLIREFAHDAVGNGLEVEVQGAPMSASAVEGTTGAFQARLRMDRKLSRLELWSLGSMQGGQERGEQCLMKLPLQQVKQITKLSGVEPGDVTEADGAAGGARTEATSKVEGSSSPDRTSRQAKGSAASSSPRFGAVLCITRRLAAAPDTRLAFESANGRDRAYTCLRIFQMSVDQSAEGHSREAESDATGYESSVPTVT
mmetsp:Transcript_75133/g.199525  ORF Transcript_75133/g.199525 Transcript_75133/m.199525 type:complete len:289 (-) Transcript_75133:272-1138(-)